MGIVLYFALLQSYQTFEEWTKKNIKTHLCAQLCHHVCQVLSCMAKNDWFFFSFPPLCCCCCLTQYSVVATAITYGTMFGLGTALAYTPPLGVAMRWFPKSKVPFIYYVSTFFCFWGALLARDLYIGKNQKLCQNQTSK